MSKEYYPNGFLKSCMLSELFPISKESWDKIHSDFDKMIRGELRGLIL